jgi:hypothetical protein
MYICSNLSNLQDVSHQVNIIATIIRQLSELMYNIVAECVHYTSLC